MTKNDFGVFEITVPAVKGAPAIAHGSKVKVRFAIPSSRGPAHAILDGSRSR